MTQANLRLIRSSFALLTVLVLFLAPAQPSFGLAVVLAHEHEEASVANSGHPTDPPEETPLDEPETELLEEPEHPENQENPENLEHPQLPEHPDEPPSDHSGGSSSPEHTEEPEPSHSPALPPHCPGSIGDYNVILGTNASETLEGTEGADFIWGGEGNDIINARAGADCVDAGEGNDIVNGSEGNDVIAGGEGNDIIDGGADFDICSGGPGHNIITNCEDGDGEEPPDEEEPPVEPEPAAIGGLKFNDANGSGVKDDDETGLAGWTINLTGAATTSTTTASDGSYLFASLATGAYKVCEDLQAGWLQTHPATTTANTVECDNGTNGYELELSAEEISLGNDFGNTQTATTTPPGDGVPPASDGGGGSSGGSSGGVSGPGQPSGPVFTAACVASPAVAGLGQPVFFAAGEANGASPVSFSWSGDITGSGLTQTASFAAAGVKNVIVTATDSTGRVATGNCSLTVVSGALVPELGLGGAPGELPGVTGPAAPTSPEELEEEETSPEGETAGERGGLLAAIAQAGLGTILLWILIALVIIGIIVFFLMWRRREEEQKPGGPKGPPSGGARPPTIPL